MNNHRHKILVSGATGMLGGALLKELDLRSKYVIYYVSRNNIRTCNIGSLILPEQINDIEFEAFFHCAAEVNVNFCEKNFGHALKSNCEYTRFLFERVNANYNFYISTDSVYEGISGSYKESDETKPVNNYAVSKLCGEEVSKNAVDNLYVIRTNIIGDNSKNKGSLFEWATKELIIGNTINGFSNIYFNPLSVQHLSFVLLKMLDEKVPFGTYNLGCDKIISKYEFLLEVANLIEVDPSLVNPLEFNPSPMGARRPMNTTLNCTKIKNQIKNLDLSFQTSLEMLMKSKNEKN